MTHLHQIRNSVLSKQEELPCKTVLFDVTSRCGTVGDGELPRGNATNASESVSESFVTSGGFSTLKGIARQQADDRVVGGRIDEKRESMVRIPPVDELFRQEAIPKERTKYYPSQSANILMKNFFERNPTTHLDSSHPTTSFNADQMIQFARAIGLQVSLASYSKLEDLLLKARGGSAAYPVTSRYLARKSPFPCVAGSSMGDSVASRSVYLLPAITETEGTNVIVSGDVLEEPCSSRQADVSLAMGTEGSEKRGSDCLKTLQQFNSSQKKKKMHLCKWTR